jgi:hypothetical protein
LLARRRRGAAQHSRREKPDADEEEEHEDYRARTHVVGLHGAWRRDKSVFTADAAAEDFHAVETGVYVLVTRALSRSRARRQRPGGHMYLRRGRFTVVSRDV